MITDITTVKLLGALFTRTGAGEPDASTAGDLGDIYLDVDKDSDTYGKSYLCTDTDPKTWELDDREDARIKIGIERVERDYLTIRGKPFADGVFPDGADIVAGEMVLYLLGIIEGRGKDSESIGDRSAGYEKKIAGYPASLVSQISRYVDVV